MEVCYTPIDKVFNGSGLLFIKKAILARTLNKKSHEGTVFPFRENGLRGLGQKFESNWNKKIKPETHYWILHPVWPSWLIVLGLILGKVLGKSAISYCESII